MKKRAEEIFHKEMLAILTAQTKEEFDSSLLKMASLADILDQSGDEISANKIDELLKQAGFWSDLFSGMAGGGGVKLWDAIKGGRLKESLGEIVKGALMGAGTAVVADMVIKWLDEVPIVGPYLKELAGAEKVRALLIGVIGSAVADSDIANKLVDNIIVKIEELLGWAKKKEQVQPKPAPQPSKAENVPGVIPFKPKAAPAPEKPAEEEGSDTFKFQVAGELKND